MKVEISREEALKIYARISKEIVDGMDGFERYLVYHCDAEPIEAEPLPEQPKRIEKVGKLHEDLPHYNLLQIIMKVDELVEEVNTLKGI